MPEEIMHRGDYPGAMTAKCAAAGPAIKYDSRVTCPDCLLIRIRRNAVQMAQLDLTPDQRDTALRIMTAVGSACGCPCLDCLLNQCYACIEDFHRRQSHSDSLP